MFMIYLGIRMDIYISDGRLNTTYQVLLKSIYLNIPDIKH